MSVLTIQEAQFEDAVKSGITMVKFDGKWCAPCRALQPIMEELSSQYGPKVTIVKTDVEESPALAERFRITGMPTVIVFQHGEPVDMLIGFRPKAAYEAVINRLSH